MEIENEFILSQDGYASIDFTLLDRPNNNIASAPEATAVLLPDGHAADSSFPSFDLLDGSGVVGSYGYAPEGDDNQSLDQSRDGSEKDVYKEQAMHSNADNGGAASNVEYGEYQIPHSEQKTSVDFFAKNQAPQQQQQQSQLSLFGSDGAEENQEFFEAGQTSQQSQPAANSWWTPDNNWNPNNNQRDQSQVYNWAAMTEEQRRIMQMRMGGSQNSSEYPGALYSMPQAVNSDPTPSMYSFLPTNTNRLHKIPQPAEGGLNASRGQASVTERNSQYDFQGLLNGSGFQQPGPSAQNLGLVEQQRYRAMHEQQMRMQEARNREQQLRMQGASGREQQLRDQQLREQQLREHQLREQQLRMQEANSREQQLREQQLRDQQLREQQLREHQLRMQEANSREQQLRLQGQQNQSFSKYDNQNMEVSPLKVSDYDFSNGGDYTMRGQSQSEVRQQLDEAEAQMWRQQQQQQRQQLPAWQQPRQFSNYANNSYEDMHQRQQAQAKQSFQQQQQQQVFSGNQNQASGNQFQAFLGEGSLQDLPQVMQPERVNSQQMGVEGHQPFIQPNLQAFNQNNAGNHMYSPQNEAAAGQGSINYLLGQDPSFSWHQLAMKASGLDQPMHASAASSSKAGQLNPFASAQGGAVSGFSGGMGKQPTPTPQINRPIPRSIAAGPSPLFGADGRPAPTDDHASKAKLLFGQAMQQQQQSQSQAAKHMQGFPGNSQQGNYSPVNRQALEEAQRRQHQSFRSGAVQQDGAPHVKLFAQSLSGSLDPVQQQQQQQQLLAASRNAENFQVRPVNLMHHMPPARGNHLAANPGHHYQHGVNQLAGSFLQNANDRKQQPMWNNYEMEADASQVEVPVVMPGNTDSMLKSNNWSAGSEGHPAPDNDSSLAFERSKLQQNAWNVHGAQPSNSQSSGDLGSRHPNSQSGAIVQQRAPKSTGGHPLAPQANGNMMHQGSLQSGPSMLDVSELEANGRQRELQSAQEETNWRNHSLLQASPQQSAATNSSLQEFTDMDRSQSNWKSLWQNVPTGGNASQLSETEKEQQSTMWAQNNSHVTEPQPHLSDDPNARIAQRGWGGAQGSMQAAVSGESQQTPRDEQQVMLSGSPQPQSLQNVDGRQQLSNQGPSFQEAMSQASLSDNDPSPASRHADQSFQHSSPYSHPIEMDRNVINQNSDPGGHSSSISLEHQRSFSQANLPNQGRINAWAPDTRQRFDDTSVPLLDSSGQHEGRVQLQLNGQQVENRLSAMMNARASSMQEESSGTQPLRPMNALGGFRHQNDHERNASMNGGTEGVMAGWAANQIRTEQSKLGGRPLQFGNVLGNASTEHFVPSRPESAGDEQTNYTNSMLAQRARYSGRRDVVDPGRNTLELLSRTEQEAEASEDQDGSALEDGSGPAATSLAHLRPGPMGTSPLQRPTPSRPDLMSREQVDLQLSRNMEGYHQGRNLLHDFSREEARAYGQAQMQPQMQPQMQSQMQSQMQAHMQAQMQSQMQAQMQAQSMRAAAQLQAENMARQGQVQDRMSMNPALLGANRHHPLDSRQKAEMFYRSLNQAQKIQFQQRLAQQNHLRSTAAAHSMDHSNMPSGLDPRIAAQQHMSRMGYQDRPGMPAGLSSEKQSTVSEMVTGSPGQVGVGLPQAQPGASQQSQQLQQAAPASPMLKKRKEYPPLVPWRTTISQGSTNLPTTSRAELEWAAATNSAPDQERFNDAVEALDVTTLCVKRARRRLKFTTQLMQQIVPALPCQLFRGNSLDDYKSATFVLAKFAVSEACWLATGLNRESSGAVAIEEITENSKPSDATAIEERTETSKPSGAVAIDENSKTSDTVAIDENSKPSDAVAIEEKTENSKPSDAVAIEEKTENSKSSGAVAVIEESTENGNGNISPAKSDQRLAVVKPDSSLAIPSQLEIRFKQKMAEFQSKLSRLECAPTASKLARELHDLDKLAVVNRMAMVHGPEFVSGLTNPTGSPRGKQDTHGEAPVMYSPENAYPERFVAAVFVPQTIPDNLILFPL